MQWQCCRMGWECEFCLLFAGCCDFVTVALWGRGPHHGAREVHPEADTGRPCCIVLVRVCLPTGEVGASVLLLGKHCTTCARQNPAFFHSSTSHSEPLLRDAHTLFGGTAPYPSLHWQSYPCIPLQLVQNAEWIMYRIRIGSYLLY
jgi:hypothetical protein